MIVDRTSLAVRPLAAEVLPALRARATSRRTATPLDWSNELVAHAVGHLRQGNRQRRAAKRPHGVALANMSLGGRRSRGVQIFVQQVAKIE